jgi:hypothetical protein
VKPSFPPAPLVMAPPPLAPGHPTRTAANIAGKWARPGGILTRIPVEVDAGAARVEVSHPEGRHSIEINVQRHLALADSASVQLVAINSKGDMQRAASFPSPGIVDLDFGHDGQALYLLSPDSLVVLAVAAKGGPAVRERRAMEHRSPRALVTRSGIPILALLHGAGITLFDTRVATSISESGRIVLPNGAGAAAFSPDGKYLALISTKGNALSLIRLGDSPSVVARLPLLVGEPVQLLQDLAFSPSGDELWVLSGNNSASVQAGLRPTQVLVVGVDSEALTFSRSTKIGAAQAPQEMAVSQRRAVMAAAAVRSTRQRAAMVLGAVPNALVLDGAKADNNQGQILSFDLDGNSSVLATGAAVYSQMRLSHKQGRVYAATRNLEPGQRSLGITSASLLDGDSQYLRLSDDSESNLLKSVPLAIAP